MASQLRTGQRVEEVHATAGNSIVDGETADGASPKLSASLAPPSLALNVVSEFDMESFSDAVRITPCIWITSCRSYKKQ